MNTQRNIGAVYDDVSPSGKVDATGSTPTSVLYPFYNSLAFPISLLNSQFYQS